MIFLPPNVTSLIQPLDQGVIQILNVVIEVFFICSLLKTDCSLQDFQSGLNIKDAVFAAAIAWENVKSQTLQRAWRKIWPSVTSDAEPMNIITVEDDLSIQDHSEFMMLIQNKSSNIPIANLTEKDIVECVTPDYYEPVVEDLLDDYYSE